MTFFIILDNCLLSLYTFSPKPFFKFRIVFF